MEALPTQLTPQRDTLKRVDTWALREVVREHPRAPVRQTVCGVERYQKRVELLTFGEGSAWWSGVIQCRSKGCPTCFVARRHKLAAELDWTVCERERETRAQSWLATFTIRHHEGDPVTICRDVRTAWRRLQQSRRFYNWRRSNGVEYICAEEVTHGANGYHPHLHVLWMPARELNPLDEFRYEFGMFNDWRAAVVKVIGPEHAPDHRYGLDLQPCDSAKYLGKLGLELSDPGVVKGRSPLRMLADGHTDRYMELQRSRRRARDVTFTRGLKSIRESTPIGEVLEAAQLAELSGQGWNTLRAMGWRAPLDVAEASKDPETAEVALRAALGCLYEQATEVRSYDHGTQTEGLAAAIRASNL